MTARLVVTGALAGAGLGYVFQRAELRTSGEAGKAPERFHLAWVAPRGQR